MSVFGLAAALIQALGRRRTMPTAATAPGTASRVTRYANEAVLPFYVLHLPVMVAIGAMWSTGRWAPSPTYLVISFASLAVTLASTTSASGERPSCGCCSECGEALSGPAPSTTAR